MSLEQKDAARIAVLESLYELGNGDAGQFVEYERLAGPTGLTLSEVVGAAKYLMGQGLADSTFSDKLVALTSRGVVTWESILREQPEEPVQQPDPSTARTHGSAARATIREDAERVLRALAEFSTEAGDERRGRHNLPGPTLQQVLANAYGHPLTPDRLNDAIEILESSGHVRVVRVLGSAPYSFHAVELTPEGRLQYEDSVAEPPGPVGEGSDARTQDSRPSEPRMASAQTPEDNTPAAFLIGTLDSEGVLSALKASGRTYTIRRIDSSAANWARICEQLEQEPVACVLLKLTGVTYGHLCDDDYSAVRDRLLRQISSVRHVVFIYEKLLSGVVEQDQAADDSEGDEYPLTPFFRIPPEDQRRRVQAMLSERSLEVLPYRSNAELTTLAATFISQVDQGLLFRIYIPAHQLWAQETDRMLTLFREYLTKVGHHDVTLNQRRTTKGVIYEFFSAQRGDDRRHLATSALAAEFGDFSHLLDLCVTDSTKAEQLLRDKSVDPAQVHAVLSRFSKEARRLQVDLRQERESKLLAIRHRLESELSDLFPSDFSISDIARLVDATVPTIEGMATAVVGGHQPLRLTANTGASVTVNLNPQIVQSVNAVVAREINGDVQLSADDHRIMQLIRQHAPERETELGSAVRELADETLPRAERISAKQRLKGFLFQLAGKVPDIAAGVFQAYLESKLGL